jgi:glyoxylase-like metal-dependent hydrolase (beta-lactamase superfamily II)
VTEVTALGDADGTFASLREAFGLDDDAVWHLPFYSYLLRHDGHTVVVDTGVGSPAGDDPFLPARQGRLPAELARAGVARADVDLVVLTHLHVDHVGWNMFDGEPFFPKARYVAHRDDFDWITAVRPDRPYVRDNVLALAATGALELADGSAVELLPGLELRRTGGHTPGHAIVEAREVTLVGDLAVHERQLADPGLPYVAEDDPAAAARLRRQLLPDFAASGRLLGFGHLGLGRVAGAGDGGFAWLPAD